MAVELFMGYPGFHRFTALDWAPFNFCYSTASTIYSLKCQLSPPPNPCPPQVIGGGEGLSKISECIIQKPAGELRMGSKFFVLYIICNYSILIYSLVSLEASTCMDIISPKE